MGLLAFIAIANDTGSSYKSCHCKAGRKAGVDSQPYGIGPLETCPPPGSPFADPATADAPYEEPQTVSKSPPKQIVRINSQKFPPFLSPIHTSASLNPLAYRSIA